MLVIITKNPAADPDVRLFTKWVSKPFSHETAMPTA